jgi:plastocyanin
MKAKASLIFIFVLLLSACGAEAGLTPAGSLPPISTENPTAVSSQVPVMAPSLEPAVDSTLEPTISSTLESTSTVQGLSDEVEIEIEDFAFTPATVEVKVGTTVKWGNKDGVRHTITADDGTWGSGPLNKGDKFSFTFTQAGTYTYHCSPHPSMKGTIVVVSS